LTAEWVERHPLAVQWQFAGNELGAEVEAARARQAL
jgi:hypothetical protein